MHILALLRPRGLTFIRTDCMDFHMKTTLMIPDPLMRRLKREAARQGTTISALVERALRLLLDERAPAAELPELPRFSCGRPSVDVANREALYQVMEQD
jgi:hypothetical protein